MLVDRLESWASAEAAKRPTPRTIGAWNVGKCARANWLMLHDAPAEPLQGRALLTFDLGDRVEDAIFDFLERAGIGFIRTNEKRDTVLLEPVGRVRADGMVQDGEDIIPVEVKSMSDFAFKRLAEQGLIDSSYRAQAECYMRAYRSERCVLVGYRKETSHMAEVVVERDDAVWAGILAACDIARGDVIPDRPAEYQPDSNCHGCDGRGVTKHKPPRPHEACGGTGKNPLGTLIPNFPCGYCAFKATCWSDLGKLDLTTNGDGRPYWRLVVDRAEAHSPA